MDNAKDILKWVIAGILLFAIIFFAFGVGVWVGQERAQFSFRWAENYHRNFGGPRRGFFGNFPDMDFINGHGIFGQVISINGNTIIVKGQDNVEKTVVVSSKTTIRNNASLVPLSSVIVGNSVVVIGAPNAQGQVEATFIRVLPSASSLLLPGSHFNEI